MTGTKFDPFGKVKVEPSIQSYGYEDLGDNPATHRWRAQWSYNYYGSCDGIYLTAHPVLKLTPCGAWIAEYSYRQATKQPWEEGAPAMEWVIDSSGKKRFIHNNSGQGWAKPTREEALHSLAIRLTRWTNNIRREVEKARSAANALMALRPQEADFAKTAINNLKGIEEEYWG